MSIRLRRQPKFGGHTAAAGLSIEPDKVDAFREDFCEQIIDQVSVEELIPDLDIDAEALIGHLTFKMMNDLERLAPFGQKNPRPLMCASEGRLAEPPKTINEFRGYRSVQLHLVDFRPSEGSPALAGDAGSEVATQV